MIPRHITPLILRYAEQYPVLALVGPRQSGKTTLAKALFPKHRYLSLENISLRQHASSDPSGFLATYGTHLILDEVQHVPALFSYLQELVDLDQRPGQYILTGSSQFLLVESITQSLAGRVITFKLFPLTFAELSGYPPDKSGETLFQEQIPHRKDVSLEELHNILLTGLYPRIYDKHLDSEKWYENYVMTYVERDVRMLLNVRNIRTFEHFLLLCASRSGQLMDFTDISNALGIAVSTVKEWISILETSGIVFILPPYFENFSKRVVKTPKLYFVDTGLLCHLLGIRTVDHLKTHPLIGSIFETFIVSECYKRFYHLGEKPRIYFWRDQGQQEIDLLIDNGGVGFPIEIKLAQTIHTDFRKGMLHWMHLKQNRAQKGAIIYCGPTRDPHQSIPAWPWFTV